MPAARSARRSHELVTEAGAIRRRRGARRTSLLIVGAAATAAVTLAGCASGQVAETAEIVPAVQGSSSHAGPIDLHDVGVAPPPDQVYRRGADAELQFVVVNSGIDPDKLVWVTTPAATRVKIDSGPIALAPTTSVRVGVSGGPRVTLTGLTHSLHAGQSFSITFGFRDAGRTTFTVPVNAPLKAVSPAPVQNTSAANEEAAG